MKREAKIRIDDRFLSLVGDDTALDLGLLEGTEWVLERTKAGITWRRANDGLLKLYVEVTNACNLKCRTCVRNVWQEKIGHMDEATFERVIAGLKGLPSVQVVHFGGYGEPLTHPRIFEMIRSVKELGLRTELITNGTLLNEEQRRRLLNSGLDLLVVSIDGGREATHDEIRPGSEFSTVLRNLKRLAAEKDRSESRYPEVGLSFVAMKGNLEELLLVKRLAPQLGASSIKVSNLLPHTEDMKERVLYSSLIISTCPIKTGPMRSDPLVVVPPLDRTPEISEIVRKLTIGRANVELADVDWNRVRNYCRFVQEGIAFVRWDGAIAPCMPLLHSYPCYVLGRHKHIVSHTFGSINEQKLADIWADRGYREFRDRVKKFEFSPCVDCGGCEMSASNQENCFGDPAPVCGDCLWAQGIIQCP